MLPRQVKFFCSPRNITVCLRPVNDNNMRGAFWRNVFCRVYSAGRALKFDAESDTQTEEHETRGYTKDTNANVSGPFMTADLPPWDVMLARKVTGLTPEQLSVTYWAPGAYLVSWTTGTEQVRTLLHTSGVETKVRQLLTFSTLSPVSKLYSVQFLTLLSLEYFCATCQKRCIHRL